MVGSFTADSVPLPRLESTGAPARADVVIEGLEQAGPSFAGHVFLDRPDATLDTPRTAYEGYAGSFSVFGQGEAAAEARDEIAPDPRASLAPITKRVVATEALSAALARGARDVSVTIVPEGRGGEPAPLSPTRVALELR